MSNDELKQNPNPQPLTEGQRAILDSITPKSALSDAATQLPVSDDYVAMALEYSRNFATAKPNIGSMEKEHILGLCALLERVIVRFAALASKASPDDQRQEGAGRNRVAEWGEYLAVGAERLLDAINSLGRAEEGEGTGPDEAAAIEHAEQALTEAMTGLRSDVYEFRKRAASPPTEAAAAVGDRADWMRDESRAPWARNSLKVRLAEMREAANRCRRAFNKDWMGLPARYVADAYDEAAAVLQAKLAALSPTASAAREGAK